MTIQDIEQIAQVSKSLDVRPEFLRRIERRQCELTDPASPPNPYYNFLYLLSHLSMFYFKVELGTLHGGATMHLQPYCDLYGRTYTVDPYSSPTLLIPEHYQGIIIEHCDSLDFEIPYPMLKIKINLLFADSVHTYDHTSKEYVKYRPHMAQGSIMLFDDISLSPDMERFWNELPEPKVSLPMLHETGFGACLIE